MIIMKRTILTILCALAATFCAMAQEDGADDIIPSVMIVPSQKWCTQKGYSHKVTENGRVKDLPEIERAIREDPDLTVVMATVSTLLTDYGIQPVDLLTELDNMDFNEAETRHAKSQASGAGTAVDPIDILMSRINVDMKLEVDWKVNKNGPKFSIWYHISGKDAYTGNEVCSASGTGEPSFSAEPSVLLAEAVSSQMDLFKAKMHDVLVGYHANGRPVRIDFKVVNNGSGLTLNKRFNGQELWNIIDRWAKKNAKRFKAVTISHTPNLMTMKPVNIPMFDEEGLPQTSDGFATKLRDFLAAPPYNIPSYSTFAGLGWTTIHLGEE